MDREQTELRIKEIIISSLELEDVKPADIGTEEPLFGEGLGLDSIDALELGMAVKKAFGITFSKDPAANRKVFHSVKTLADHVMAGGEATSPSLQ